MIKTYKYKLYSNNNNKKLIQQIELASWIYNHCIALHKRYYKLYHKSLDLNKLQIHVTRLKKKQKYKIWNSLNSQSIQDITQRIDKAYKLFFSNLKKKIRSSPPNFKKRIKYKSFTLKQCGYKLLEDNKIKIGKLKYRYCKSRNIEGDIKTLTIKRDNLGDIYLYFCIDGKSNSEIKTKTGKIAGFDYGCKVFLTSNENKEIESPLFFKESQDKIKKLNQMLSKKIKGSNNRKKVIRNLNREHLNISNKRRDFHFKTAHQLLDEYDILVFENLNMKWMQMGHGKKTMEHGFSEFLNILEYLAKENEKEVIKISRTFPSSQLCSSCGYRYKELRLDEREWICPECGTVHKRDHNSGINILNEGIRVYNKDRALSFDLRHYKSLIDSEGGSDNSPEGYIKADVDYQSLATG